MSSLQPIVSVLKPNPPPIWYVTNGEVTVGPVFTDLLIRGVEHGRVPDYCRVSADYGRWRPLEAVREIAVRMRPAAQTGDTILAVHERERALERIRNDDDLLHHVTGIAMFVTGAESGMLHLRDRHRQSFTTRAVLGPMPAACLGQTLPETDPVVSSARLGRPVVGPPYGPAEDALAVRFATSAGGVCGAAMLPIFLGNSLAAMLELSRPGHAFRRGDLRRAEHAAQRALGRRASSR